MREFSSLRVRLGVSLGVLSASIMIASCGARSELWIDALDASVAADATADRADAGDARDVLDVQDTLPPIDVKPLPDANKQDCPAGETYIYLITTSYELYAFYPPDNRFIFIGKIQCPGQGSTTPFSMAVDRKGVAYIVYNDGRLFRVSTLTAACVATPYVPNQLGATTFGMGFSSDQGGATESLYIATDIGTKFLAKIDTTTYTLNKVGDFSSTIGRAELTGTGSGGLYAFYDDAVSSYIGQIDKTNAKLTGESKLQGVQMGQGWAFAFWGGDFYLFTAPNGQSLVTRYRPSNNSVVEVARLSSVIVGAGVSTCAPQE
jgi:hypothetical protein